MDLQIYFLNFHLEFTAIWTWCTIATMHRYSVVITYRYTWGNKWKIKDSPSNILAENTLTKVHCLPTVIMTKAFYWIAVSLSSMVPIVIIKEAICIEWIIVNKSYVHVYRFVLDKNHKLFWWKAIIANLWNH